MPMPMPNAVLHAHCASMFYFSSTELDQLIITGFNVQS